MPRELTRHDPSHLTIAHISDLHFRLDTNFPQLEPKQEDNPQKTRKMIKGDARLRSLVNDIADQKADILAVTGDIAENPFADQLRNFLVPAEGNETELSEFNDSLRNTFERAREFLNNVCVACNINPRALFVIPGNHDYRVQGTYSGWLSRKYKAHAAESNFAEVFEGCGGNEDVTVTCKAPGAGPAIVLRLACLDSNDTDAYLNFATGAIAQTKLETIGSLRTVPALINSSVFRICLVHHHPLPVVTADLLRDDQARPADLIAKLRKLYTTFTGEQTNVFKNGGTFLLKCLDNDVDLIMHGHQHRTWFSNIQYPARTDKRLLVAGAPSAGVLVNGSFGYCLYELDLTGNIKVTERTSPESLTGYSSSKPFFLYGSDELRRTRRRHLIGQLENKSIASLGSKYGIATADEVVRHVRIDEDGNARMTLTYRDLVPRGRETQPWLPIRTLAPGAFVGLESPRIQILRDQYNYYNRPEWRAVPLGEGQQGLVGQVVFDPELHPERPLSFEIEFLICNAFQFARERRRAFSKPPESQEHHFGIVRAVYPSVAKDVILFPPPLAPVDRPRLHVSRQGEPPDIVESEHSTDALSHSSERGIISLTVREPFPDYQYKISWELLSDKQINDMRYSKEGIDRFQRLAQTSAPAEPLKVILTKVLESLKSELAATEAPRIIDDKTEVSLHIAVVSSSGSGETRTIKTELHRFADLASVATGNNTFVPGEGIAGQAFRSRQPILFERQGNQGSQFYVVRPNQEHTHSVLYGVPLPVIPSARATAPVYGVLSVGTYAEHSGLQELKNDPIRGFFTDVVMGWFNEQVQEILLDKNKP